MAIFPTPQGMVDLIEWETDVDAFSKTFPKMYYLVWWLRNYIDMELYDGKHSVVITENCDLIVIGEKWWDVQGKHMSALYTMMENEEFDGNPGSSWWGSSKGGSLVIWNVAGAIINRLDVARAFEDDRSATCSGMVGDRLRNGDLAALQSELPEQLFSFLQWLEEQSSDVLEKLEGQPIPFNPNA